jgi:hypothetical protein
MFVAAGTSLLKSLQRFKPGTRPEYKAGIEEVFTDPFGTGVYNERIKTSEVPRQLEQIKAELDRIEISEDADQIKEILIRIKKTLREMPEEKKVDD